jgi:hypothetical protein
MQRAVRLANRTDKPNERQADGAAAAPQDVMIWDSHLEYGAIRAARSMRQRRRARPSSTSWMRQPDRRAASASAPVPPAPRLTPTPVLHLEGTREPSVAEAQALALTELAARAATDPYRSQRAILLTAEGYSAASRRVPLSNLHERGQSLGIGVHVSA